MLGRSKEFDGKVENYASSIFKGYIKKIACSALVYRQLGAKSSVYTGKPVVTWWDIVIIYRYAKSSSSYIITPSLPHRNGATLR